MALLNYRNGFALVMEDVGAVSLAEYTANAKQLDNIQSNNTNLMGRCIYLDPPPIPLNQGVGCE